MKAILARWCLLAAGIVVMAAGIVLVTKTNLGTSPISSLGFVLSLSFPDVSYGAFMFAWNIALLLGQVAVLRRDFRAAALLQIPISVLFSLGIDLFNGLLAPYAPSSYAESAALLAAGVAPGRLGIDKSWPSKFLIRVLEARPDVAPVLGSAPVDEARMIKDEAEIAAMRRASRINDQVVGQAIAALHAGASETEIADLVERLFREKGANRSSEGQLVCFGPNGADPHHGPDGTRLREGDSVVLDIFIPIGRYWCDMTRTVFFRSASEEGRRVYETVKAANLAAEAVIRPGMPMREIDRAARRVIEEAGYGPHFTHRLGHGCGLDCHEPPDNSSACGVLTRPGMVFSVEPGIYLTGKLGVRIEDLVLVTEDGCEVLNAYPKELQVVG